MLFWILMLLDLIAAGFFAYHMGTTILGYVVFGFGAYFILVLLSMLFMGFLSLLLGRRDKFVLKKSTKYEITYRDFDLIKVLNKQGRIEEVSTHLIDNTITDPEVLAPYLEINIYNSGGWRKYWLWEMYSDEVRYIVYLPVKSTED